MNRKLVFAVSLFVLLCSLLYVRFNLVEVKSSNGYPVAPYFILTDIDGISFSLSDYRGRVVLLDFFHTNCTPSVNQFSELMILHEDFGEKLVIISISTENETILRDFREAYSINWTIARDTSNVFDMYTVSYLPTLVIIDQDGCIRYRYEGLTEESLLRPEIESLFPNTVYVDDDNVAGPWNGTKEHPYQNITSGLEHASDNDIVFVQNGTYYEHVVVNKSISLFGQDRSTTILDGNETGIVVNITENNVNVAGFTIQNSGGLDFGIVLSNVDCCNITGNNVANNWRGIRVEYSSNSNIISGNNVTANSHDGISLYSSSSNTVCENNVTANNWWGIRFYNSSSNTICGNHITNNRIGIFLEYSSNSNIISGNNITNNGDGIRLHSSSSNNTISGNNITNSLDGIYFWYSSNNIISGNNMANNDCGILLDSSSNNVISGNTIMANNGFGIYLWYSSNNTVYHNNFVSNTGQVKNCESTNIWDNSYPCGGNYWNNYAGVDEKSGPNQDQLGNDGIGDTSYDIDENNMDNYPLLGMFSDFNATSEHNIQTVCNSTISGFQFNSTAIFFSVTGEDGTTGFCRVCIPHELISPPYNVIINSELTEVLHEYSYDNVTCIYFTYLHSTHEVIIIPEFPSFLILPPFMIAAVLAVMICRRRHAV